MVKCIYQISILLYADDMILLAKNETDLRYMLDAMNEWAINAPAY